MLLYQKQSKKIKTKVYKCKKLMKMIYDI